ncbi:MAG: glycosyltransferase, partial [Caldimonas sp.]
MNVERMASNIQSASSRIHVLEVVGNAIVGGMENSVARLIERLPPQRFSLSVLCPFESPFTDELRGLGAEVYITAMPEDPAWSSIQFACALIKANCVDILHSHLANAHLLAGVAGRLAGKPVLATIHGRQLTSMDLEVHRTANTHLHVVCKQSYFHALGIGVNPAQLHFIANGVDTDVFKPQRKTAGPLRQRFGIPDDAKVVGFVGRLSAEKGPDVFLRTALGVRETSPRTRFLVVGEGPMQKQLHSFIQQFDLAPTVHLVGMQTDMPAVMAEIDVLVSASH